MWVGGKNLFACVSFLGVIPSGGEKHINKIFGKSQDSPVKIMSMCFSSVVLSLPIFGDFSDWFFSAFSAY